MPPRVVSSVFVGRTAELERLTAAYRKAARGEPSVVLLVGEAGVGKSRLVEAASARAIAEGAQVLVGGCVELGGEGLPYAPIVDALRQLVRATPAAELDEMLGAGRRDLARLLPDLDPDAAGLVSSDPGAVSRLFEFFLALVGRLAVARPLVLVIEDLHWADRSTLDLLAFLVRTLRSERVNLVATYRSEDVGRQHPARRLLAEVERLRNVERIELHRFDRDEVVQQLRGILGETPTAAVVDDVVRRSEGNAFLVEELLAARQSGDGGLSPALRDVLLSRVEALSAPTQSVLRAASVGGQRIGHGLLASVAGVDSATLGQAIREAVDHHVLVAEQSGDGYVFRHALVREAIYDDMLPGDRVQLHALYADALEHDPPSAGGSAALATLLAHHWYAAHDVAKALPNTVEAGRQGLAAYAYAEAVQHLERALEAWPGVDGAAGIAGLDLIELLDLAASANVRVGNLRRATALRDRALALIDRRVDPVRAGMLLALRGRPERDQFRAEAIADLEEALSLLPAAAPERAAVLGSLAAAWLVVKGDYTMSRQAAEQAIEAAKANHDDRQRADAMVTLASATFYSGDRDAGIAVMMEGLALARQADDTDTVLRAHVNLSDTLRAMGRLAEAIDVAREGSKLAEQVGSRITAIFVTANLAEALMQRGDWDDAEAVVADALTIAPQGVPEAWLRQNLLELAIGRGNWEDAHRYSDLLADHGDAQLAMRGRTLAADLARAEGSLMDARNILADSLATTTLETPYAWPQLSLAMRVEADIAQAARAAGTDLDTEHAARITAIAEAAATLADDLPALQGYIALTAAEAERASANPVLEAWSTAADAWRAAGELPRLAYCLFRLADAQLLTGERTAAASSLIEAAEIAADLRAKSLLDEIEDLAKRARIPLGGEPVEETDENQRLGLTAREIEVLRLLADGRSNLDIAERLYISRKTASVHVSNILAKLGAGNRGEAAAIAFRTGLLT